MSREIFKRAFLRGLLRDAREVLPPPAKTTRSSVGQILRRARALLDVGIPSEALEILAELDARSTSGFEPSRLTAQAWLALGAVQPAQDALARAVQAAEGADQLARIQALQDFIQAKLGERGLADWAEFEGLVATAVDLGLADSAAAVLRRRLGEGCRRKDSNVILESAFPVLRVLRPGPAAELLGALAELYERVGFGPPCRRALALLNGAGAEGFGPDTLALAEGDKFGACLAEAYAAGGLWREAIVRLVPRPGRVDMLAESLCELARCVGQDVLEGVDLDFRPPGARKVFDLFPFNGEFRMLELKLAEMSPWVDQFVIIEAAQTFTGRPKPLHFAERRQAFAAYADKIVHVQLDAFPPHLTTPWAREFFQRDKGVLGLVGRCAPDDLAIISDVDEIIRPEAVRQVSDPLTGASLRTFQYFFNYELVAKPPVIKAVFAQAALLARNGSSYLRTGAPRYAPRLFVADAGWHFTSVGSPEALELKMQSYSHTEWSHLDRSHFAALAEQIRTGGLRSDGVRRELDELPEAIRRTPELYRDWLL